MDNYPSRAEHSDREGREVPKGHNYDSSAPSESHEDTLSFLVVDDQLEERDTLVVIHDELAADVGV